MFSRQKDAETAPTAFSYALAEKANGLEWTPAADTRSWGRISKGFIADRINFSSRISNSVSHLFPGGGLHPLFE